MSDIRDIRNILEQRKGKKEQIQSSLDKTRQAIKEKKRDLRRHEQAREILREVGLKTQQALQYHISEITTLALDAVFPKPYQLVAEFVQRRNKTECDLYFTRGESKVDPLTGSGGGAVDVSSFALRVASWSMQNPRSYPILILDEPFKHLSSDLLPQAGEMIKQISDRLKLQVLMITHAEELIGGADKVFSAVIRKGMTRIQ